MIALGEGVFAGEASFEEPQQIKGETRKELIEKRTDLSAFLLEIRGGPRMVAGTF